MHKIAMWGACLLAAIVAAVPAWAGIERRQAEAVLLFAETSGAPGADRDAPTLGTYVKTDAFPLTMTARRLAYYQRAGVASVEARFMVQVQGDAPGWVRLTVGDKVAATTIPAGYDGEWALAVNVAGLAVGQYEASLDLGWMPHSVGRRLEIGSLTVWALR